MAVDPLYSEDLVFRAAEGYFDGINKVNCSFSSVIIPPLTLACLRKQASSPEKLNSEINHCGRCRSSKDKAR